MTFEKGNIPWNNGLTKETDERIKRIALLKVGKKRSEETRLKISESLRGKNHPFYGTHRSLETRKRISEAKTKKDPENLSEIFTRDHKQVLFGSLLGDCSLISSGKNCYYEETHSIRQKDYLIWKNNFLKIFNGYTKFKVYKSSKSSKMYKSFLLKTLSFPILYNYYKEFYQHGRKVINKNILDQLRELGLTIWYLDDGHVTPEGLIRFSTDGYTYEEHLLIKKWFEEKWSVFPRIGKRNRKYYYLLFNKRDSNRLLEIFKQAFIKFKLPKCMAYKLGPLWDGNNVKLKKFKEKRRIYKRLWRKKRREIREREKLEKLNILLNKIKKLYYGDKLTLEEVGEIVGYTHSGLIKIMKKFNLPRRTTYETKKLIKERNKVNK